jgi:hypothetical protein
MRLGGEMEAGGRCRIMPVTIGNIPVIRCLAVVKLVEDRMAAVLNELGLGVP